MRDNTINTGLFKLNEREWHNDDVRTVIVMGVSRSGTSMITGFLESLNVNMGNKKSFGSLEDHEIFSILEAKIFNEEAFKEIVKKKNDTYLIWGWKRPESYNYLKRAIHILTNPIFIFTFRDLLAISQRNNMVEGLNIHKALHDNNWRYQNIISFIKDTKQPTLLVSYEKAILDKKALIFTLADFLGIAINKNEITQMIELNSSKHADYMKTLERK